MEKNKNITFFMLVTNNDVVIANYSIKSYVKLMNTSISFQLIIYCNCLTHKNKSKYFKKWLKLNYIKIIDNNIKNETNKYVPGEIIVSPEGIKRYRDSSCENYDEIWSRELKKINTDFIATVDADFEIYSKNFILAALGILENDNNIGVVSTDYTPLSLNYYDSYSKKIINLNERWNTWFCIYRKECLNVEVSHFYFEELNKFNQNVDVYDSAAYLQKHIRESLKMECVCLIEIYQSNFIHYGAFSKNKSLNEINILIYRILAKLSKIGFFTEKGKITKRLNSVIKKLSLYLFINIFNKSQKERRKYEFNLD